MRYISVEWVGDNALKEYGPIPKTLMKRYDLKGLGKCAKTWQYCAVLEHELNNNITNGFFHKIVSEILNTIKTENIISNSCNMHDFYLNNKKHNKKLPIDYSLLHGICDRGDFDDSKNEFRRIIWCAKLIHKRYPNLQIF